ncbi:fimbrial protein [Rahnella perminowiae]|uniref:Type 1 fimbrial protein n=1 Tax=Rahnella perminowiae TaxID=2816244 RepID=A0ABS6L1F4_9GAMM|nr:MULTISPECIES: fimbrial protein [Rahnella]MBU9835687.1 type 1 fimbrial protein [Rahnella perminowiae]MCR8999041.1 type 1 fimbrial protein [Rahnella perminowiae]MCX2941809.1 fimbrial protein [Rahnella perminowiae]UJD87515.1 type 1 fimbrial protein [Rahnella aquatilis]
MKTKLKLLAGGIFMAMAVNSYAIDGAINFTGAIVEEACEINGGEELSIPLGTYSAAQFQEIGDLSPKIPFTLPLDNCPVPSESNPTPHFRIWLESDTVTDTTDLIALGNDYGDTMSDGVGIRIEDAKTNQIMKINGLPDMIYPIPAKIMNVDLLAYYESYKLPGDITAGAADARVKVTLDYR